MKRYILSLILCMLTAVSMSATTYAVEDVPNVHKLDRTRFVSNPDGILSAGAVTHIDSVVSRLRQLTTAEMAVVVVDDIEGGDIDIYANDLYNLWGLGKKDNNNGVLFLVVKDLRKAVIRTGPGVEGVLTDATCGRILRQQLFPALSEGDFDTGLLLASQAIAAEMGDEDSAAELRSSLDDADDIDDVSPALVYFILCFIATIIMAIAVGGKLLQMHGRSPYDKYMAFDSWRAPLMVISVGFCFIPLVITLPLLLMLRHWRNHPRRCPNCGHKMIKIDEVHDNDFLTPSQDCEERIGSVDYDVWHCEECGETDIYPFVNKSLPLVECSCCHARTAKLTGANVLIQPTTAHKGIGVKTYTCLNCHKQTQVKYDIAKLAPVVVVPAGGGRGFGGGGGGGSFGGGFGGGFTGGGGASGGW